MPLGGGASLRSLTLRKSAGSGKPPASALSAFSPLGLSAWHLTNLVLAEGPRHAAAWKPCETVQRVFMLPLRNHNAFWSSKLDQARIDREPHNSCCLAFAPGGINGRDKFTKCHCLLLVIVLHAFPLCLARQVRPPGSQADKPFTRNPHEPGRWRGNALSSITRPDAPSIATASGYTDPNSLSHSSRFDSSIFTGLGSSMSLSPVTGIRMGPEFSIFAHCTARAVIPLWGKTRPLVVAGAPAQTVPGSKIEVGFSPIDRLNRPQIIFACRFGGAALRCV